MAAHLVASTASAALLTASFRTAPQSQRAFVTADAGNAIMESMAGVGPETGNKPFDPLDLSSSRFPFLESDEAKMAWFRHAELKHGRVCMLAFIGYLVTANGITFGGYIDPAADLKYSDLLGADPFAIWDAVPVLVKIQFFSIITALEFASEAGQEHYTKGGKVGYAPQVLKFLPASIVKAEPSEKAVITELKNGRLAMIGMASLYAANKIPDSVPFLKATFGQ